MTITSNATRNEYTATSGQTVFTYKFKIFADTEIRCFVTPTGQEPNDSTDEVVISSVTGVGNEAGGTITIPAVTLGYAVTIISDIAEERTIDYQVNGDFSAPVVNSDFDRTVSLVKQLSDSVSRGLSFQESEQGVGDINLEAPIATNLLQWNDDGDGVQNYPIQTETLVGNHVNNLTAFKAYDVTDIVAGDTILLNGYYQQGDGGGGIFYWTDEDLTFSIIQDTKNGIYVPPDSDPTGATGGWIRLRDFGSHNVRWFGAQDGATVDATEAFIAAHDMLPSLGGEVFIPEGSYLLNKTTQAEQFIVWRSNVTVRGVGHASQLVHTESGTVTGNQGVVMVIPKDDATTPLSNTILRDFRITGPTPATGGAVTAATHVLGVFVIAGLTQDVVDTLVDSVICEKIQAACFPISSQATPGVKNIRYTNCWAINSRQDGFNPFSGFVENYVVDGCFAIDLDGFGIESGAARGNVIINNVIQRVGQAGIGLEYNNTESPGYEVLIENNLITDIGTTAYPASHAISLGQAQIPINTTIMNNSIARVGGAAVKINLTPIHINVRNNVIKDIGQDAPIAAIFTGAAGTYIDVSGNHISNYTSGYDMTYGVALAGVGSATNSVKGNIVLGETTGKISVNAPSQVTYGLTGAFDNTANENTSTTETDLSTYTIKAGTFTDKGQGLRIGMWGVTGLNSNSKIARVYVDGTQIMNSGTVTTYGGEWAVDMKIIRLSDTIVQTVVTGSMLSAPWGTTTTVVNVTSLAATDIDIKMTGQGDATGDVTQTGYSVEALEIGGIIS